MISLHKIKHIYLYPGFTDMRCGIKSLSVKVNSSFTPEESESCLFIFCGRRKNSIKILEFSKDGVWLYQKVFNASRFRWPKYEETTIELEERQLLWLLDGLSIVQVKASKETGNLVRF